MSTSWSCEYVLPLADSGATLETVGGKGASLARLVAGGLPVPDGFHVATAAYRRFVADNGLQPGILAALEGVDPGRPDTLAAAAAAIGGLFAAAPTPPDLAGAIALAYAELPGREPVVAVRSSATAEDLPEASFAGQQDTFLNVQGHSQVLEAVKRCWASLWTARAIGYRARRGIGPESVSLAVVVQELVPAEAAGILFTADPLTGGRDRATINAAWGLGEAVVGGLVTPDILVVDKASGAVLDRQTADKQVMTARVDGGTAEQPVPAELRRAPVLDDATAGELVRLAVRIETLYGLPVDVEWALAGGALAIVQARPITALPEPQAPAAVEWKRPNPKGQYMRGSIVDLMPNPVSPLFATFGIPAITGQGINQVLGPLTRSRPRLPDDYITTINEYAYMSASFTPRQWWWILTRMMPSFPRMLRQAIPLWRDEIRPHYAATVARWQGRPLPAMPTGELWTGIQEVNDAAMLHVASLLVATTGASAGAEMLFTRIYHRMVRRDGDPAAATFLMGYDSTPIRAEKSLYDLAEWVRVRSALAAYIGGTRSADLAARLSGSFLPPAETAEVQDWPGFHERFHAYLQDYGHMIYDLDFARPLPLDDAVPMLETVKMYLRGAGVNPHERQHEAEQNRQQAAEATLNRLRRLRRWAFRKTLGMAQTMAQVRENALADIGLGYPLLRGMLCELGRRFVQAGAIAQPGDIFWLQAAEVRAMVSDPATRTAPGDLQARVAQRRATHEALKGAIPPPTLPPRKKYMGINMEDFAPVAEGEQTGDTLKGVAASAGRVTAPACVLHGTHDFGQMRPGDVLVAATTTPAWTPLFAMAAAVVTDIGGPLSHGSIVAREYGIPAVMGTGVATRRIKSGQAITVDGSAGTVKLG